MHDRTNDPAANAKARGAESPGIRELAQLGVTTDDVTGAITIRRHPNMDAVTWRRLRDGMIALLEAEGFVREPVSR